MKTKRFRNATAAFSIVELMVAIGVLVFGIYAVYEQFIQTRDLGRRNLARAQGRFLAHQKLEELRACAYNDLKAFKPPEEFTRIETTPRFWSKTELNSRPADGRIEIVVSVGWEPVGPNHDKFLEGRVVSAKGVIYP